MSGGPYRLAQGGAIDRDKPLRVRFDGWSYPGYAGDTLASLLLANGVRLMGRSFKYHRPRGVLGLGSEEPNALVELGEGARREPNTRATVIEAYDGLAARAQNARPSVGFDVMAVNRLFERFLVAGFYYKTFMWPAPFWEKLYERRIRQAAGLGRAAEAGDPDRYEHVHHHADVVVVGAGPAGLMAALSASTGGARVLLVEERPWLGGRLAFERRRIDGAPAQQWVDRAEAELAAREHVTILRRATVTATYDHTVLTAIERSADHDPGLIEAGHARQRLWIIRAGRVIVATGAVERPLVFGGNDLPGVMLASAARGYANRFAVAPGQRCVVATNNDEAYATALDLADHGVTVSAVLDARTRLGGAAARASERGIRVLSGALPGAARGARQVRGVDVVDASGKRLQRLACDCLAVSGGYSPDVSLTSQLGTPPVWEPERAMFVPGELPAGYRSAGACNGAITLAACLEEGRQAGEEAGRGAGHAPGSAAAATVPQADDEVAGDGALGLEPVWRVPGRRKAFVDFQHDVTADDIGLANREGFRSVEHLKRYTTLGMATDQGKTSNVNGLALLAAAQERPIPEVGTTRFRPPAVPTAVGAYAGHRRGRHFAPVRRTAMYHWHREARASFVEAGHWLRPRSYPSAGEALADAVAREARAVRASVGVCDVSTLGKIDVFGADAGEFLSRIYINGFRKLAVGKVRYGAMLRPDGHLLDDGTTSRLADDHFLMTTTTANAGKVLAHLEYHAQVAWPDLDVAVCSATEQWATMSVAGPRSRDLLMAALPEADLSNEALPFMGFAEIPGDYPVRVFRVSFSGEMAYEVSVPWGYGEDMWRRIMEAGREWDITPYGTEALSVLRIEKGHAAGPEFDGRTTALDIGLGGMVRAQKQPFVGQRLGERPGLSGEHRPRMVGLRAPGDATALRGGAHLFDQGGRQHLDDALGWLSSVTYSPHVGAWIALGFLRDGESRHGDTVLAVSPLHGESVPVQVGPPCFIDPEGSRLRG